MDDCLESGYSDRYKEAIDLWRWSVREDLLNVYIDVYLCVYMCVFVYIFRYIQILYIYIYKCVFVLYIYMCVFVYIEYTVCTNIYICMCILFQPSHRFSSLFLYRPEAR